MITFSGIWVTPTTGLVPCPADIAVHSGRITRYAGALWSSLLAHHVFVAELVWAETVLKQGRCDLPTWAWAFMHDAHETFMGEIPRRWKNRERKEQEKSADARLMKAYKLDGYSIDHALIKRMDERALLAEAIALELPGFREKYMAENSLGSFQEPDVAELDMMRAIIHSEFYQVEHCTDPASYGVMGAAAVYVDIWNGKLEKALESFRKLLNNVLPEIQA